MQPHVLDHAAPDRLHAIDARIMRLTTFAYIPLCATILGLVLSGLFISTRTDPVDITTFTWLWLGLSTISGALWTLAFRDIFAPILAQRRPQHAHLHPAPHDVVRAILCEHGWADAHATTCEATIGPECSTSPPRCYLRVGRTPLDLDGVQHANLVLSTTGSRGSWGIVHDHNQTLSITLAKASAHQRLHTTRRLAARRAQNLAPFP